MIGLALWYAQYLATLKPKRPHVRNYTVRGFRFHKAHLDFVGYWRHGHACM